MITIRHASEDDASDIQNVYYKTWLETYPNDEVGITKEDVEESFKDSFTDQKIKDFNERLKNIPANSKLLVAVDTETNKIIALSINPGNPDQVDTTYYLYEVTYFDKEKDIIVQVATYNNKAISFYESLGFIDTGKRFTEERHRMPVTKIMIPEMEMIKKVH